MPSSLLSGASYSISAKPTEPCFSPAPSSSTTSRMIGRKALQLAHQDAVHKVTKGIREEVDTRASSSSSAGVRMLLQAFLLAFRFLKTTRILYGRIVDAIFRQRLARDGEAAHCHTSSQQYWLNSRRWYIHEETLKGIMRVKV